MKKHFPLFFLCFVLVTQSAKAQTWQSFGPLLVNQPSDGAIDEPAMASDTVGNLYLCYQDKRAGNKMTVRKWNGSWSTVGARGFSAGQINNTSIAIDPSGTPYVAYNDYANAGKVTVMKYDGSAWVSLGSLGTTRVSSFPNHLVIDSKGNPYVAYLDSGGLVIVEKYTGGNWSTVGQQNFAVTSNPYFNLAIDPHDTLYVSYVGSSTKMSVVKFNGSSWIMVGNANFSNGAAYAQSLAVDGNGHPYVFFRNNFNDNYNGVVMEYNGSSWVNLDSVTLGADYQGILGRIIVDRTGTPYITFEYWDNDYFLAVWKYNGSNWVGVNSPASPSLGSSMTSYASLVVSPQGVLSLAYTGDPYLGPSYLFSPAVVLQYNGSAWASLGTNNFNTDDVAITSLALYNNVPYAVLQSEQYAYAVARYNGNNWVFVGKDNFGSPNCIAFNKAGTPYVSCVNTANTQLVMKFDGSNWVQVGDTISTDGSGMYIAIDDNGTPYVATILNTPSIDGAISVVKFNGTNWLPVGDTVYPPGTYFADISIAVDHSGVPYIAFQDNYGCEDCGPSFQEVGVMELIGYDWVLLRDSLFGDPMATPAALVVDNSNHLLIAHSRSDNYYQSQNNFNDIPYNAAVLNGYNGRSWDTIGGEVLINNFPAAGTRGLSLDKNQTPYMVISDDSSVYTDNGYPYYLYRSTVVKYNGTGWSEVGNTYADGISGPCNSLAIDTNNVVYLAGDTSWGYKFVQSANPPVLSIPAMADTFFCGGSSASVQINVTGTFNAGNVFTVQLVDPTFTNIVNIGMLTGTGDGTANVVFPAITGYENFYYLRVVSSNPPLQSDCGPHLISYPGPIILEPGPTQTLSGCNPVMLGGFPTGISQDGTGDPYAPGFYGVLGYSWSPVYGLDSAFAANPHVSGLTSDTTYTVVATDYYGCTAKASVLVKAVNDSTTGVALAVTPGDSICDGFTTVTFTATPLNNSTSPTYMWYEGNYMEQSGPSPVFTGDLFNNGEFVTCIMNSSNTVCGYMNASSTIEMTVIYAPEFVSIFTNATDTVCAGSNIFFDASANVGPSSTYDFYVNNILVQSGSSNSFNSTTLNNNDQLSCIVTGGGANNCSDGTPFYSNVYTVTLSTSPRPTIAITANPGNNICTGTVARFTATPTNAGSSPIYIWELNGLIVQNSPSAVYANPTLNNGDTIICFISIDSPCLSMVASNSIVMAVNPVVTPTISITSNLASNICAGQIGTFRATAANAGTTPVYTWKIDGVTVQSGRSAVYSKLFEANTIYGTKFNISCVLTSDAPCASPPTVTSDTISLNLESKPIRTTIRGQSSGVCGGSTEKYTCDAVAGATDYLWVFPRGCKIDSGQLTTSITVTFPANYDSAQIEVLTDNSCGMGAPAYLTVTCDVRSVETGVEELLVSDNVKLNVYPNPNNGQMYIDLQQAEPEPVSYKVFNMMGQIVYQYNSNEPVADFQQQLDLSTQASGMYFIQVRTGETVLEKSVVVTK